ncbi:MAG: 3-isopropylmalate dehydrogenase [Ruminococcaceae bacterium]|nr:3-isopropylmalate dehydrogenase [Oscillospiraceae bacterium]
MEKSIAVIRGDGIGPEIIEEALRALDAVERRFGHSFNTSEVLMGGAAIDAVGNPLPDETLTVCLASDAVLLGAVGGPKWESLPGDQRPEKGLLGIRKGMGLFANLRPARLLPALADASPLRAEICAAGIDFLVVRELIGGIYFGEHKTTGAPGSRQAIDVMAYGEAEIRRILHVAFQSARVRRSKVCSVDKANVLDTSRLWRAVAEEVAKEYPDVAFENMLVDNAAMQLVRNPGQFDVMVTENMFGDILSDEASMITGSIGMIPSASLGENGPGLYEPIHGSAPDIAGTGKANPVGTILSVAMMLRYSLGMPAEADTVEAAVDTALAAGARTADTAKPGETVLTCRQMGEKIAQLIQEV